jgi:hypothetical protein
MPRTRRDQTRIVWTQLTSSVTPEIAEDDPLLKITLAKLTAIEADVDRLVMERDSFQARKQETTRKIQSALVEGRKVANVLRIGLRQHFGETNEGLVAFGIKPTRSRKRSLKATDAAAANPDPSGDTPA